MYPVKIGNVEVLVKSLDEAVELIAKYQRLNPSAVSAKGHQLEATAEPSIIGIADFVSDLPEWPQKALRVIYEIGRGSPVTSEELRKNLGLANNMALTGRVITPLTRHARRAKIDTKSVLKTDRRRNRDGSLEPVYNIPRESLEAVKRGLGI